MTLAEARDGQNLLISGISSPEVMLQALRFGIDTGTAVTVAKNIAGGPVVICKNQLEIAIGRELAESIQVSLRG